MKRKHVIGNVTADAGDSGFLAAQDQPKSREDSDCAAAVTGELAEKQDKTPDVPSRKSRKDLMIRLPLGVAVLRDPAFNKGTAFSRSGEGFTRNSGPSTSPRF